jgi:hypothetical protein
LTAGSVRKRQWNVTSTPALINQQWLLIPLDDRAESDARARELNKGDADENSL